MFPRIDDALLARLDVAGPRYTSYPTVPSWNDAFDDVDAARALARASESPDPLSLYVHIPFCKEMCRYCGCNVIVTKDPRRADRYLEVVTRELEMLARRLAPRRDLARLHLGGGTPTFLDEEQLTRLWNAITARFGIAPGAEIALEIDPAVTSEGQLRLLRSFGFNRISMGVQDFDPAVQEGVNRIQSVEETDAMLKLARSLGFRSVNFDMIYGLPRQTPESWRRTLESVLALGPDRISLFSFAFVPEAKPHQRLLPIADLPTGAAKLRLFGLGHDLFTAAGYRDIGMDHFARPEDELAIAQAEGRLWRDFQGYTVRRMDTVGVGVTGISDIGGAYVQNVRSLLGYEESVDAMKLPTWRGIELTDDDRRRRAAITSIMCNFQTELEGFDEERQALAPLVADGLCELDDRRVVLTPLGKVFVRNVAMVFDAYLGAQKRTRFSRTV